MNLEIQMHSPAHSCIVCQDLKKEGIKKYIRVRSKRAMASDNNAIYKMSRSQATPLFCDCLHRKGQKCTNACGVCDCLSECAESLASDGRDLP